LPILEIGHDGFARSTFVGTTNEAGNKDPLGGGQVSSRVWISIEGNMMKFRGELHRESGSSQADTGALYECQKTRQEHCSTDIFRNKIQPEQLTRASRYSVVLIRLPW
jgi:hypothetical protein